MKYRITRTKQYQAENSPEIWDGDIVEFEPVEDDPKEETNVSLADKLVPYIYEKYGYSGCNEVSQIAREHFREHPEEIDCVPCGKVVELIPQKMAVKKGMVSLDSVLETFDNAKILHCSTIGHAKRELRQAIERMRK